MNYKSEAHKMANVYKSRSYGTVAVSKIFTSSYVPSIRINELTFSLSSALSLYLMIDCGTVTIAETDLDEIILLNTI